VFIDNLAFKLVNNILCVNYVDKILKLFLYLELLVNECELLRGQLLKDPNEAFQERLLQELVGLDLLALPVNLRDDIILKVSILLFQGVSDVGVFYHQVLETVYFLILHLLI